MRLAPSGRLPNSSGASLSASVAGGGAYHSMTAPCAGPAGPAGGSKPDISPAAAAAAGGVVLVARKRAELAGACPRAYTHARQENGGMGGPGAGGARGEGTAGRGRVRRHVGRAWAVVGSGRR